MTDLKALDTLIEAVERGGEWISVKADAAFDDKANSVMARRAYGGQGDPHRPGSLDAAKALHDALLPGWGWKIEVQGPLAFAWVGKPDEMLFRHHNSSWENPARAWLLAFLRAYRAQIGGDA